MITEKGKLSTKMKAKGVTLGNVHLFFVQWKGGVSGHSVITLT